MQKQLALLFCLCVSWPFIGGANTTFINLTAQPVTAIGITVTDPNLGSIFQVSNAGTATITLNTDGTTSTSNPSFAVPIHGSGAANGRLHITGSSTGTINITIAGPASGTGDFNLTDSTPNNLTARLYQSASQGSTPGTLITDASFTCTLSSSACDVYLGAEVDIPASTVDTQNTFSSGALAITLTY